MNTFLSGVTVVVAFVFTLSMYYRLKGYIMIETFKRETESLDEAEEALTSNVSVTKLGWIRLIFEISLEVLCLGIVLCIFSLFTTHGSYYGLALLTMISSSFRGFDEYVTYKRKVSGSPDDVKM